MRFVLRASLILLRHSTSLLRLPPTVKSRRTPEPAGRGGGGAAADESGEAADADAGAKGADGGGDSGDGRGQLMSSRKFSSSTVT